jgi:hypothetical protein
MTEKGAVLRRLCTIQVIEGGALIDESIFSQGVNEIRFL